MDIIFLHLDMHLSCRRAKIRKNDNVFTYLGDNDIILISKNNMINYFN